MTDPQKKAFDFAFDLTKQLITLSTGLIALSVTFFKEIFGISTVLGYSNYVLLVSWLFFISSIFFGLRALGALTGNLDPIPLKKKQNDSEEMIYEKPEPILTITSKNVIYRQILQSISFLIGLFFLCIFGCIGMTQNNSTKSPQKQDTETIYTDTLNLPIDKN